MNAWVGWDLGGAHIKAALCQDGVIRRVWQVPCPLWRGLEFFDRAVTTITKSLPVCDHGVTMTGEMADIFPSREAGVRALLTRLAGLLEGSIQIFADSGFIPLSELDSIDHRQIASQNWLLPGLWLSRQLANALYIDIGSTTTDILAIVSHRPATQNGDDHRRLHTGELVYLGVVRTPLMALTREVPFRGQMISLMAEQFATTADVYRILGLLSPDKDQAETADGRPKSPEASMRRMARMVGLDLENAPVSAWHHLARTFHEIIMQRLTLACLRHSQGTQVLVGAGVGRFLVPELARRLNLPFRDVSDFIPESFPGNFTAADCAPAAALALLLARFDGDSDKMKPG